MRAPLCTDEAIVAIGTAASCMALEAANVKGMNAETRFFVKAAAFSPPVVFFAKYHFAIPQNGMEAGA